MTTPPTPTTGHVLCDKEDKERTHFWCPCKVGIMNWPALWIVFGHTPSMNPGGTGHDSDCGQYWQKLVKQKEEEVMSEEIADYLHACQAAAENTAVSVHYREGGKFDSLAARSVRKLYAELAQANAELEGLRVKLARPQWPTQWPTPISTKYRLPTERDGRVFATDTSLEGWRDIPWNCVTASANSHWLHQPPIPKQEPEVSEAEKFWNEHRLDNLHIKQLVIAAYTAGKESK